MANINRESINLLDHAVVLVVVCTIALVGNHIGPDIPVGDALIGMLIVYALVIVGLLITKFAPFYLPSVAWISLVAILVTLPVTPGSDWVVSQVEKVNVLAVATPVLAYAGLAITKREIVIFKSSGWKIGIIAMLVFIGTYVGSAFVAEAVLRLQGLI